jgi:hypothetical protein
MGDVIHLGPHSNMSPEQALAQASREQWDEVIIVGYHRDSADLVVRSSHMTRRDALWIAEYLKLHALDQL